MNGRSANPESTKMADPYFPSWIWWQIVNREARFPIELPSNHRSISLSFEYIHVWQTDGQTDGRTDNADHYYTLHCGGPANKNASWSSTTTYTKLKPAWALKERINQLQSTTTTKLQNRKLINDSYTIGSHNTVFTIISHKRWDNFKKI